MLYAMHGVHLRAPSTLGITFGGAASFANGTPSGRQTGLAYMHMPYEHFCPRTYFVSRTLYIEHVQPQQS